MPRRATSRPWLACALGLTTAVAFAACTTDAPRGEAVGVAESPIFANGGFEQGDAGPPPPGWVVLTYLNASGPTLQTPQTFSGLNLSTGGASLTTELVAVSQPEADLGAAASLRVCRYGRQCAQVNFHGSATYGHDKNANALTQTVTIGAGDVDPVDGLVHVRLVVAPVLQNPPHAPTEQPYYFLQIVNVTQNVVLYQDFSASGPSAPWKSVNGGTSSEIDYRDWSLVDVSPADGKLAQGDVVQLLVLGAGCTLGTHFGEVYVDGVGAVLPGIFVSGRGPAQAFAGSNITYTLAYENGSSAAETGVVIDFPTPPLTTYRSMTAPPGATCVTPPVGAAGNVACTLSGPLAASAAGSMTVTVAVASDATGAVVASTYDIHSTQETALFGNKVVTAIVCATDADCAAGTWCAEAASQCQPTLANGAPLPTDAPHVSPTLNGVCTPAAGALTCTSHQCDTDNKCGYLNGDGSCDAGSAATVCRSGVCDPDLKCGYLNGDGPCSAGSAATVCRSGFCDTDLRCGYAPSHGPCTTANAATVCRPGVCDADLKCGYAASHGPCTTANAATVCRSGACSANGTCEPSGGCNVDADCTGGQWCNETTHACVDPLPNGTTVATDASHVSPTLKGLCTAAAGALTCAAGVCDTVDNKCGYRNGDGTCSAANAAVVCRSGACDPDLKCGYALADGPCDATNATVVCRSGVCGGDGTCRPSVSGGCNVDADCVSGQWCNESNHACAKRLVNGTALPTDAPHVNPTLNGICTAAAATLTCTSGVCDPFDDACGYLDGSGPCSAANATVVCRSGSCSVDATCKTAGSCNAEGDCTGTKFCNLSAHVCTAPFANGGGPCTAANAAVVCHSGACSVNGTCKPAGGCNVDGDCAGGKWCSEGTHVCTSPLANGATVPTDATHDSPPLTGVCTEAAGALTCASGVCNTADDRCGYPNGGGPCTAADGATVCRSGACGAGGAGGVCVSCASNAQCHGTTPLCNVTTHTCVGCTSDASCGPSSFCAQSAQCLPKGPAGHGCSAGNACLTNLCIEGECADIRGSGSGLLCTASATAGAGNEAPSGVAGTLLVMAAVAHRRRASRSRKGARRGPS